MDFKNWTEQIKTDEPDLKEFIEKLQPYLTDTGFNGQEFERKISLGLQKKEAEINELLKPEVNAENQ